MAGDSVDVTFNHGSAPPYAIPEVAAFFPAAIVLILYAGVASVSFPRVGIWYGTIICYLAVMAFYVLRLAVESIFVNKHKKPAQ